MDHDRQRLFLRYRTTQANLLAKARKAVEDYRKARASEEKQAIHKQKNPPELSWQEEIESMKRTSINLGYLTPDGKPTGKKP